MSETVFRITPEEKNAILAIHNKSEDDIEEYINDIKVWIGKQKHLPNDEDTDRLKILLIFNKYSLEKVKTKLDAYYSLKHLLPEYYSENNPLNPNIAEQMKSLELFPLPCLNQDLCRVYIFRLSPECSHFDMMLFSKIFFMQIELRLSYDPCVGDHYVCDLKNMKFEHIVKITPTFLKRNYTLLQKAYSDRMKGLHYINIPPGGATIVNLMKKIVSEKTAIRVHAHENLESVHKYISKDVLPQTYGGTYNKSEEELYNTWKSFLVSKDSWLINQATKRSDENQRVGEPYDQDLFGMYGSFRQMNID